MKSTFKSKKMFFVSGITLFFLMPFSIHAQCPFGEKYNCLGECGRFIDENQDSFCDNGLIQVEEVKTETQTVVKPRQILINKRLKRLKVKLHSIICDEKVFSFFLLLPINRLQRKNKLFKKK